MKKLIFILIMTLCLSFTSCCDNYDCKNINTSIKIRGYRIDNVKVDNHYYIVAKSRLNSGGISIIHSESCPCKKTNIYKKVE